MPDGLFPQRRKNFSMAQTQKFEKYIDNYTLKNKLHRLMWNICYAVCFRPFGLPFFKKWRNFVLKCWGAQIGKGSIVHASAQIWAPWNLQVGLQTCIGPHSIIYNPGKVILGNKVAISQYAYLCTATHDYTSPRHTLYWRDIVVDDFAWVAARAFIAPGVHVGERAIIGACSVMTKDAEPWGIYAGNPAKFLKKRELKDEQ